MSGHLRAALLVNARSRSGRRAFATARRTLEDAGVALGECALAAERGPLLQALERAVAAGIELVVVGGGDGTVHALLPALLDAGATLAVLPLGTGNDFARSLELPLDVAQACRVVAEGRTERVDVGLVNGRPFLNAVSLGLTTELTRKLTPTSKRLLGPVAYPVAAVRAALSMRAFEAEVEVDGERRSVRALQLVVGNARYQGGGRVIAPDAGPTDARLHGYAMLARGHGRWRHLKDLVRVGRATRSGEHVDDAAVWSFSGARVRVVTSPVRSVTADGERIGQTPAELLVRAACLPVRVLPDARLGP